MEYFITCHLDKDLNLMINVKQLKHLNASHGNIIETFCYANLIYLILNEYEMVKGNPNIS